MRARVTFPCLLLLLSSCEDPSLRRLEDRTQARILEATVISSNRGQFERERESLLREITRLRADAAAVDRLGSTTFRVDDPGGVLAMIEMERGERRPVTVESLRCGSDGCVGELRAIPLPPWTPASALTVADLPPRPLWPPARARWDRLKMGLERLDALRAGLGQLGDVRDRMEELKTLRDAIDLPQRRAALVVQSAKDALEAGASTVGIVGFDYEDGYGVRVTAPGARAALAGALARQGAVSIEGEQLTVKVETSATAAVRKLLQKPRLP